MLAPHTSKQPLFAAPKSLFAKVDELSSSLHQHTAVGTESNLGKHLPNSELREEAQKASESISSRTRKRSPSPSRCWLPNFYLYLQKDWAQSLPYLLRTAKQRRPEGSNRWSTPANLAEVEDIQDDPWAFSPRGIDSRPPPSVPSLSLWTDWILSRMPPYLDPPPGCSLDPLEPLLYLVKSVRWESQFHWFGHLVLLLAGSVLASVLSPQPQSEVSHSQCLRRRWSKDTAASTFASVHENGIISEVGWVMSLKGLEPKYIDVARPCKGDAKLQFALSHPLSNSQISIVNPDLFLANTSHWSLQWNVS